MAYLYQFQATRTQTRAPKHRPIVYSKDQIVADNARSASATSLLDIHGAIIAAKKAGDTVKVAELKAQLQATRDAGK